MNLALRIIRIVWPLLVACRSCPECPKPVPPAPVAIPATPIPCDLPPLPKPIDLHPTFVDANTVQFVKDDVTAIATYTLALTQWIAAARVCLPTEKP